MTDSEDTMKNMQKNIYYQSEWPNREFLPVEVKPGLLLTFGGDVLSVGLLDTNGVLKLVIDIVLAIDDGVINGEFINENIIDEVIEGVIDEEQVDVDVDVDVDVAMAILVDDILETMEAADDEGSDEIVKEGQSVKRFV